MYFRSQGQDENLKPLEELNKFLEFKNNCVDCDFFDKRLILNDVNNIPENINQETLEVVNKIQLMKYYQVLIKNQEQIKIIKDWRRGQRMKINLF